MNGVNYEENNKKKIDISFYVKFKQYLHFKLPKVYNKCRFFKTKWKYQKNMKIKKKINISKRFIAKKGIKM